MIIFEHGFIPLLRTGTIRNRDDQNSKLERGSRGRESGKLNMDMVCKGRTL